MPCIRAFPNNYGANRAISRAMELADILWRYCTYNTREYSRYLPAILLPDYCQALFQFQQCTLPGKAPETKFSRKSDSRCSESIKPRRPFTSVFFFRVSLIAKCIRNGTRGTKIPESLEILITHAKCMRFGRRARWTEEFGRRSERVWPLLNYHVN